MKIIWIMLMLISASISASLREYAPLQDAMVDRQDGVTITQKVTAQDDGTLRIRLQIDMKEEIAALQAEAGKHSLQEVQPVDPIAIGRESAVQRAVAAAYPDVRGGVCGRGGYCAAGVERAR